MRYRPFVRSRAPPRIFLVGGDDQDVIQEGMIGLFKAISRFTTPTQQMSFSRFSPSCASPAS